MLQQCLLRWLAPKQTQSRQLLQLPRVAPQPWGYMRAQQWLADQSASPTAGALTLLPTMHAHILTHPWHGAVARKWQRSDLVRKIGQRHADVRDAWPGRQAGDNGEQRHIKLASEAPVGQHLAFN